MDKTPGKISLLELALAFESAEAASEYIQSLPRETVEDRHIVRLVKLATVGLRYGAGGVDKKNLPLAP